MGEIAEGVGHVAAVSLVGVEPVERAVEVVWEAAPVLVDVKWEKAQVLVPVTSCCTHFCLWSSWKAMFLAKGSNLAGFTVVTIYMSTA